MCEIVQLNTSLVKTHIGLTYGLLITVYFFSEVLHCHRSAWIPCSKGRQNLGQGCVTKGSVWKHIPACRSGRGGGDTDRRKVKPP